VQHASVEGPIGTTRAGRAQNDVGTSSWSAESSITTAPAPPRTPPPPAVSAADDPSMLRIAWERSSEARHRIVSRLRASAARTFRVAA
jgi:hypothetical protein